MNELLSIIILLRPHLGLGLKTPAEVALSHLRWKMSKTWLESV